MMDTYHQNDAARTLQQKAVNQTHSLQAEAALDEMAMAHLPVPLLHQLELYPTLTARLDTAVRALHHADYITTTA